MVGADVLRGELLDRLVDDAFGGTPSQQSHLRIAGTREARRLEELEDAVHLAPAPLHDRLPLVRIGELVADEHAVLVVLVGGDDVRMPRRPRYRARRDAALGHLVALVSAVHFRRLAGKADDLAAIARRIEVQ